MINKILSRLSCAKVTSGLQRNGDHYEIMDRWDLELQRESADHSLRRPDNEELVVDRLVGRNVPEEVADTDQHFPFRRAEVHERQRLPDLNVEARVERRTIGV